MTIPYQQYVQHLQSNIAVRAKFISEFENTIKCLKYDMSDAYEENNEELFVDLKYNYLLPAKKSFDGVVKRQKTEKEMLKYFIRLQSEWHDAIKAEAKFVEEFAHKHN